MYKQNKPVENSTSCASSIYSSRPLAIYRKELVQCDGDINKGKKENMQTSIECLQIEQNARKKLRGCNNSTNTKSFQSSKQYLQYHNKLYDQNLFTVVKSTHTTSQNIPVIKWSNSQFLQNGATSSSALIAKKKVDIHS
jgi:hypothetical protein